MSADASRYDVLLEQRRQSVVCGLSAGAETEGQLRCRRWAEEGRWIGPLKHLVAAKVRFFFASQRSVSFIAKETKRDLLALAALIESGQLKSVIDRRYPLSNTADAVRYLAEGHARGKVIISVVDEPDAE